MENVVSNMCVCGCGQQPSHGIDGTNIATHCAEKGKPLGLVNVKSKRCIGIGCNDTLATFNYPDENELLYCNGCKKEGMICLVRNTCNEEGCPNYFLLWC